MVGPSGCGKTTFLRIVAGLETASTGEVLLDGRALRGPGSDRGFVFQNDSLLPWRTVLVERHHRAGSGRPDRPADRAPRTLELLKLVGLEGFENYYPAPALRRHAPARQSRARARHRSRKSC